MAHSIPTTLSVHAGSSSPDVHTFASIGEALEWITDLVDDLDRYSGVYVTANDPVRANVCASASFHHGRRLEDLTEEDTSGEDYPDEIWSFVPRVRYVRYAGPWRLVRERA